MCTGGGGLICVLCHDMCAQVEVVLFVFCVMTCVHGWRWAYLCLCHDMCARVEVGLFVFCVMTYVHGWRWAYLCFVS